MAPDDTMITCRPAATKAATSSASVASQADFSSPLARSTSRLEPILTTMRRALVHSGRGCAEPCDLAGAAIERCCLAARALSARFLAGIAAEAQALGIARLTHANREA